MENWVCMYRKTYNGVCDQQRDITRSDQMCYYHGKVTDGYITDVDEENVVRQMPAIKL